MDAIQDILQEYTRMRDYGLDVREALQALKIYVDTLDYDSRDLLAQHLRNYEHKRQGIKPASKVLPVVDPTTGELIWIECNNCHAKNQAKEIFCYKCGELLQPIEGNRSTQQFRQATGDLFKNDYFGTDSILILSVESSNQRFELRPQRENRDLILGRAGDTPGSSLDLDFTDANGIERGVSRVHAGIQFYEAGNTLQIKDLSSANGTFINEQRLHPGERRVLRRDDEIRLGRLVLRVAFLHPGEAL